MPFAKGIWVPQSAGPAVQGGCSSAHPQAQYAADIRGVTLLTLQPIHAGTSLWMSSTDEPHPQPPANPRVTPQCHF